MIMKQLGHRDDILLLHLPDAWDRGLLGELVQLDQPWDGLVGPQE